MKLIKVMAAGFIIFNFVMMLCLIFVNLNIGIINFFGWESAGRAVYLMALFVFMICFVSWYLD